MEKYIMGKQIGQGGCSKVYLATHKESGRQYAVKMISEDTDVPTRTRDNMLKEVRMLRLLKHPYIVGCLESFWDEERGRLGIVQDFCDGGTLHTRISDMKQTGGFLEEEQIMTWFCQVVLAVQFIHSHRILHRDIKTDNVFLTKKGTVKIGDFGIAKQLSGTLDMATTLCGTPYSLSPELCQDAPYSSKSDVWALGCVLFEMCALQPPFDAQNIISLFYKIVKAEHKEVPDKYSDDMKSLISTLLTKVPEDRPSVSAILQMPYVARHLAELKEQHQLRQSETCAQPTPSSGLPTSRLPVPVAPSAVLRSSKNKSPIASKQMWVEDKPKEGISAGLCTEVGAVGGEDEGHYSDDFESSGEDEGDVADGGPAPEYEDDFESDSEENLEDLIQRAQEAEQDEYFSGAVGEGAPIRDLIQQHCLESLGQAKYDKLQQIKTSSRATPAPELRAAYECVTGREHEETCYLLSELLS